MNYFVGAFYDSIHHVGRVLKKEVLAGRNHEKGYRFARAMWDQKYTGEVKQGGVIMMMGLGGGGGWGSPFL